MKARWLVNLALFALVLMLGKAIRDEVGQVPTPPVLSDLVPSDVVHVEISRQGEPTIKLIDTPKGWLMEEPFTVDANVDRIDKLLGILGTQVHRTIPEQGAELRELGLNPAKLRVQIDGLALAIGGTDPVTGYRYVGVGGLVHLIDDLFYHLMIAPPIDYVSSSMLPRGFVPAFGRMNNVPLATEALNGISKVTAERVEPVPQDFAGSPAEVEIADGSAIRFVVSEDRRRWARPDLNLLYVLSDPPILTEDPEAIDPTPNVPAAANAPEPEASESDMPAEEVAQEPEYDPADPFAPPPEGEEPVADGNAADMAGFGSSDLNEELPAVHLSPKAHRPRPVRKPMKRIEPLEPTPIQESPKQLPQPANTKGVFGFGQDPFAPDAGQQ